MKDNDYIKLEMQAKSSNEAFARTTVACFAARLDPTLEELEDIKTAVSEAVTNCIVHAYPEEIGKVWMTVKIKPDNILEIIITDKGVGIADIDKALEPMYTTGGEDRSGMGFTIMESFMDEIKVSSKENEGTKVYMNRKIKGRGNAYD